MNNEHALWTAIDVNTAAMVVPGGLVIRTFTGAELVENVTPLGSGMVDLQHQAVGPTEAICYVPVPTGNEQSWLDQKAAAFGEMFKAAMHTEAEQAR